MCKTAQPQQRKLEGGVQVDAFALLPSDASAALSPGDASTSAITCAITAC
jgi:hypothetical protein